MAPGVAVVLDGATARTETGCVHGVAWYAAQLGARLLAGAQSDRGLVDVLAESIGQVAAQHPGCDLAHPGTPSAAVAVVRAYEDRVEHLLLADVVLAVDTASAIEEFTDDRITRVAAGPRAAAAALPRGLDRHEALRSVKQLEQRARNTPGGFWVAAADPAAAAAVVTGARPAADVRRLAILTDGAARAVDTFGLMNWHAVFAVLDHDGPSGVIRAVRAAECADPDGARWVRTKCSDDATIVYGVLRDHLR
ncbi:hypothetical protein [Candidatus Frankia alpina]|uniref:hypothetical protein n=1 Tax=Candidatus Frankia alpina TaxID=2699483 RepID=UPI001A9804F4|nr:hypothetical protein [Candidatus Frankia alpina]